MAAKKSSEVEWKRAAVEKMLAEELARPTPNPARVAQLTKMKRTPGQLLTLMHLLGDAPENASRAELLQLSYKLQAELDATPHRSPRRLDLMREISYVRIRLFPRGSERNVAALASERARVVKLAGSVKAYRSRGRNAKNGRARSDKFADDGAQRPNIRYLVSILAQRYPTKDDATPRELWEEFGEAIGKAYGAREVVSATQYRYRFWLEKAKGQSTETVGLKHFGQLLRDARRKLSRFKP